MQVYKWHHTASWDTLGSKPPEFSGGFAERAIWRRTLSAPLFGSLRTTKYAPHRKRGAFAFCIQISRSANQFCVGRMTASKPRRGCSRTSLYAPPPDGGFSLSDAEIAPSAPRALFGELLCQAVRHKCVPPPTRPMRNVLGQKGTGLSGGPISMGFGRANVQKTKKIRFLTFLPRPRCPGVRTSDSYDSRQIPPPRFRRGKVRRTGSADSVEAKARGGQLARRERSSRVR